ncbi:aminoglycoside phosphotransferase family protein [Pseudalkalibacillus sp. Hm43]|uniref:aminoglycoside phosphotransferase family protein n=1 Tax=Pseudalkalibacillus sp. Hm43 TaxID=3450742 RepID=UPI003F42667D
MPLQNDFVKNVKLYFQEQGEEWLNELPNLIRYCEEKWSMEVGEPYELSINYVAPAIMDDGTEVVIKLCIPGEGFHHELEALKLFNGQGMVRLIDSDAEKGVLILEILTPGHTLATLEDHEDTARIAARAIRKLITPAPAKTILPTTKAREENLRKQIRNHPNGIGPIPRDILDRSLDIFTFLNETTEQRYLLHGDFHHYNVLSSGDGEWTVIDPKGLVGEIEYDLIQFMLNRQTQQNAYEVIGQRVEIFTNELNLNKKRLLLWGYAHAVLSTAWSVDAKDGSYSEDFYRGIDIFQSLYQHHFKKSDMFI